MATWSSADVPANVDSVEKALLQCALALESVASDKETRVRVQGGSVRTDPTIIVQMIMDANDTPTAYISVYIPIDDDWAVSSGKLFTKALNISDAPIGAPFKTA